jgi:hypothetical protein
MPRMARVLHQLAADSSGCSQPHLAGACAGYVSALQLVNLAHGGIRSWDELGAWAAAADAGLRLLPLLADLDAHWRQLAPSTQPRGALRQEAAQLSAVLVAALWEHWAQSAYEWADAVFSDAAAPMPTAPLLQQLWQLHSTACRLVHHLAGGGKYRLADSIWMQTTGTC